MSRILVSGGGIAGATLAHHLAGDGHDVTVVEKSGARRSSGAPVDVRGPALAVAAEMGVLPRLRDAATGVRAITLVDAGGRSIASIATGAARRRGAPADLEVPRGDLAGVLYAAAADRADWIFGDAIAAVAQDAGGVGVTFERAAAGRFDLVIGADGARSHTRRLMFGARSTVRHLGLYVATVPVPGAVDPGEVVLYNEPGRLASIHPARGRAIAAFIWRAPARSGDLRDPRRQRALLSEAYRDAGWRVPELLATAGESDDLYFDAVVRVRTPRWSAGRMALVGDAADCVSLLGDGSSNAMIGAATLAAALAGRGGHAEAFARYEREHRAVVGPKQRGATVAGRVLVPAGRAGLAARNLAARLWPVAAAAARMRPGARAGTPRGRG